MCVGGGGERGGGGGGEVRGLEEPLKSLNWFTFKLLMQIKLFCVPLQHANIIVRVFTAYLFYYYFYYFLLFFIYLYFFHFYSIIFVIYSMFF